MFTVAVTNDVKDKTVISSKKFTAGLCITSTFIKQQKISSQMQSLGNYSLTVDHPKQLMGSFNIFN